MFSQLITRKLLLAAAFLAFSGCAYSFGGVTQCAQLPENLATIKRNLALHQEHMNDSEIERTLLNFTNAGGRSFSREFARLPKYFKNDIDDWIGTAERCAALPIELSVSLGGTCKKVYETFVSHWNNDRVKLETDTVVRGWLEVLGQVRGAKEYAQCLLSHEAELFAKPPNLSSEIRIATKTISDRIPLNLTIPIDFADIGKEHAEARRLPVPSETSLYCDPEDGRRSLESVRKIMKGDLSALEVTLNRGCFHVMPAPGIAFDGASRTFTGEDTIKSGAYSLGAGHESRLVVTKKTIRGITVLIQDGEEISKRSGGSSFVFVLIPDGSKVWSVTFAHKLRSSEGAAIKKAFVEGL
jgi:hypothetical protein